MAAWIVRPHLQGQALAGGKEGAGGVVVYAPNPQKAKELGSQRLNVPVHKLEAIQTEDKSFMATHGEDELSPEELEELRKDAFSGGVQVHGKWEPI